MTKRTNSSLSTYESSYSVLPGNETRATGGGLCLSDASPSTPPFVVPFDAPFLYGKENPLLFTAVPLWPFEDPGECDGPASGAESRETDKAESLSLSVSLMLRMRMRAGAESGEIKARSMEARDEEAGDEGWGSTLCRLRARASSASASRLVGADGDEKEVLADGWRKDKEGEETESGAYSGGGATLSASSSSARVRVCGTVCTGVLGVGDELGEERGRGAWAVGSESSAGDWSGSVTRGEEGCVRERMVTAVAAGRRAQRARLDRETEHRRRWS